MRCGLSLEFFSDRFLLVLVYAQLVYCCICCEAFHAFCLSPEELPTSDEADRWCCQLCQYCRVCYGQNNVRHWCYSSHSKVFQ